MKLLGLLVILSVGCFFTDAGTEISGKPPRTSKLTISSCVILFIIFVAVTRDGVEIKVCAFDEVDLAEGESYLDEGCYYMKCGQNFTLIYQWIPNCETKQSLTYIF